jgi:predicted outer membrane repeat protein
MKLFFWIVVALGTTGAAHAQMTWYVDDGNCPGPGSGTEEDPFCSIQAGIVAASDADEVVVAEGEYFENIDFIGKAITVRSTDPTVPGTILATVINGGGSGSVVTCNSREGAETVLSGFLVINGSATDGGGMFNVSSNPTVSYCSFSGNTASNRGGGMYNAGSIPTVSHCSFSENTAGNRGGGMFNAGSLSTVRECAFSRNTADVGGGMLNEGSLPTVSHCSFNGNTASTRGGGVYSEGGSPTLTQSAICRNTPDQILGGFGDGGGNAISDDHCVPVPPVASAPGDFDGDGDVDLIDFGLFQMRFTGPL